MKKTCSEMIWYDRAFREGNVDLFGEQSPLNIDERKEFLRKYLAFGKKKYGERFLYEKAVERDELERALKLISDEQKEVYSVFTRHHASQYENLFLYTDRASVKNGRIVFCEEYRTPIPCAMLVFRKPLRKAFFRVKISRSYKCNQTEGVLSTSTGRLVEFREGCRDTFRLLFAPNGNFCCPCGGEDEYHPPANYIANYPFGEWIEVTIEFGSEKALVSVFGKSFEFSLCGTTDRLFLCGGMQPADGWEFEPKEFILADGERVELFAPSARQEQKEIYLGEKSLPFAIGTVRHADEELVLRRKFNYSGAKVCSLSVEALDPCGEVFINGQSVYRATDFLAFKIDITQFVQEGENDLEIVVFPRAPEVLYQWHRHKDCYNGWFCLGAKIEESGAFIANKCRVITKKTGATVDFSVLFDTDSHSCDYDVYLAQIYPERGGPRRIGGGKCRGKIAQDFSLPLRAWYPDAPVLYEIEIILSIGGKQIYSERAETGFRTIEQKNGDILLNGEKFVLKGALSMWFLPPYEEIPVNHLCQSDAQICTQILAVKNMHGNCLRMHSLGYGSADKRIAKLCDRMGVTLIWTTRLIDSAENLRWSGKWHAAGAYVAQMREVINSPSVIAWEGSNEFHASSLEDLDRIYDEFVSYVNKEDPTRLLFPVSHIYYGGGIYDVGCKYYNNDGTVDESGNPVRSSFGWTAENVVRSAHTYALLLGYGTSWKDMREQNWKWQDELFAAKNKAYVISEYAIIGRQNPETDEAKTFINRGSYELPDEQRSLGGKLTDEEWELSQAYQAICAFSATRRLYEEGADGMLWCCLWGGANDASYLKPIVDFYGYKKYAYYVLRECFGGVFVSDSSSDVLYFSDKKIRPFACGLKAGVKYSLAVTLKNENSETIDFIEYPTFTADNYAKRFEPWLPRFPENGFYEVYYELTEKEND